MCGRAYETFTYEELSLRYLDKRPITTEDLVPIFNLCPTMNSPVLRVVDGDRRFDLMHWQLIPRWEPVFKTQLPTINAKSETILTSKLYRDLVLRQRCIIPISGFFEWKREGKRTKPFKIHLVDEPIMSLAGIWEVWRPGTPQQQWSFTIVTIAANEFMSRIHHRMPVILGREHEEAWLDPNVSDERLIESILKPCPASWLTAVEVSSLVNSAKNNSLEVLEPANEQNAPSPKLLFD